MAQVAAEYLKQAGFVVDMQVVDWATLTQRRAEPGLWDIYITHSPFLPEPALIGLLAESSPGWWSTPARKAAVDAFNSESDPQKRVALWAERAEGDLRRDAEHQDRRLQRARRAVAEARRRYARAVAVFLERSTVK